MLRKQYADVVNQVRKSIRGERYNPALVLKSGSVFPGDEMIRNISIIVALLAISLGPRLAAQQIPAAVAADPPLDKQYPPGLSMFIVPSHGAELDAWLYLASGSGPHGTVILPHGLPGYEMSGDLAQSIRRAGWNVMLFHYRGTWGVPGPFSQSSAIEDTAEVVRFLREAAYVAKYRSDPKRLVFIGHSFGGFIAGYTAARDPDIEAVAMIAAVNLGRINADPKERDARLKRWKRSYILCAELLRRSFLPKPNDTRKTGTMFSGPTRCARDRCCYWKPMIRTMPIWKLLLQCYNKRA
jgi:pimeloyl-ACP methyl ester carboxylesterase